MKQTRLIGLDIFRIIAAGAVYLYHAALLFNCNFGILQPFANTSALFMSGFFILSGFVLFATLKQQELTKLPALKSFYLKRIISLMPAYYFITIVYILFYGFESPRERFWLAPVEFLGIQSMFPTLAHALHNGGTWFISCIWICYLLYPFFHEIVKQLSVIGNLKIILVSSFLVIFFPFVTVNLTITSTYANPFFRIPEFLIGMSLAAIAEQMDRSKIPAFFFSLKAFVIELLILIVVITLASGNGTIVKDSTLYAVISLPLQLLMILSVSGITCPVLEKSGIIHYLSSISYEFYLVQFFIWEPLTSVLRRLDSDDNWLKIVLSFTACIVLAVLLHELIAKPISRLLKKKFFPESAPKKS